jgi:DegV family protein with EDD domain
MSNVRIITDTVACIPDVWAKKYKIKIVPTATIIAGGKSYIENETLSIKEAYELIRRDDTTFTTSAITPGQVLDVYRDISREAQDIIFISISSVLSAVYKSAQAAAELFKEESPKTTIKIYNSKNYGSGQGLIVLAAAKAAAQGLNLSQVCEITEEAIKKTKGVMMLDTLKYAYRTGRVSKLSAKIATLLNIKPINKVSDEGAIEVIDKVRSREAGYTKMMEFIRENGGAEEGIQFMVTHADAPDMAETICERLNQEFHCGEEIVVGDYSPVMGYGAGPGCVFIGFRPHISIAKI